MGLTNWSETLATSDYGSGLSVDTTSSRTSNLSTNSKRPRSSSFLDLVVGGTTSAWDAMQEFRTNGVDSPYCEDENTFANRAGALSGSGPVMHRTLRQHSCPERVETRTRPVSWIPSPTANEFIPRQNIPPSTNYQDFKPKTYQEVYESFQLKNYEGATKIYKENYRSIQKNYKELYSADTLDLDAQINKFEFPALDERFKPLPMMETKEFSPMEVDFVPPGLVATTDIPFSVPSGPMATSDNPFNIPSGPIAPSNGPFRVASGPIAVSDDPFKVPPGPIATSTPIDNALGMAPTATRPVKGRGDQWGEIQYNQANDMEDNHGMRGITEEQMRVLRSLPAAAVRALLSQLRCAIDGGAGAMQAASAPRRRAETQNECRFCKNNGERESYYQSHTLKDGRGAVLCPVLRAYVCGRCGATGSRAHTAKYCPLASAEDRMKSAAMLRSVRLASGRRRANAATDCDQYVLFGEPPVAATNKPIASVAPTYSDMSPLPPAWADLVKKLSATS